MDEFLTDFAHLLTDPAHLALEFMFVLIDYFIIQTVVAKWRKHFHKDIADEHAKIEAEHGLTHRDTPGPTLKVRVGGEWVSPTPEMMAIILANSIRQSHLFVDTHQTTPGARPYNYEMDGT